MRAVVAVLSAAVLGACAPKAEAPAPVQLDCSQPFEMLKARVTGQPGLAAAPREQSEPYRAYSTRDGRASYFITEPGAPAHPAVLMQQAADGGLRNSGCAYGDKPAYEQLKAYLTGLRAARK